MRYSLPIPASRNEFIRQELWVCKGSSDKLQPTALLSRTSQGYCSCQMGLAAHLPGLHSHLLRLVSSRCKPQAPAPDKKPGSSWWLHQEDRLAKCYHQCQMSHSFPHTCSICHHSHVPIPALLLSARSSPSVSLTQSQSFSPSGLTFSFMFVSYTTDSFVTLKSLQVLKTH